MAEITKVKDINSRVYLIMSGFKYKGYEMALVPLEYDSGKNILRVCTRDFVEFRASTRDYQGSPLSNWTGKGAYASTLRTWLNSNLGAREWWDKSVESLPQGERPIKPTADAMYLHPAYKIEPESYYEEPGFLNQIGPAAEGILVAVERTHASESGTQEYTDKVSIPLNVSWSFPDIFGSEYSRLGHNSANAPSLSPYLMAKYPDVGASFPKWDSKDYLPSHCPGRVSISKPYEIRYHWYNGNTSMSADEGWRCDYWAPIKIEFAINGDTPLVKVNEWTYRIDLGEVETPLISGQDTYMGERYMPFNYNYTVQGLEGSYTIEEYHDQLKVFTHVVQEGSYSREIQFEPLWDSLSPARNTYDIRVISKEKEIARRTITFDKCFKDMQPPTDTNRVSFGKISRGTKT